MRWTWICLCESDMLWHAFTHGLSKHITKKIRESISSRLRDMISHYNRFIVCVPTIAVIIGQRSYSNGRRLVACRPILTLFLHSFPISTQTRKFPPSGDRLARFQIVIFLQLYVVWILVVAYYRVFILLSILQGNQRHPNFILYHNRSISVHSLPKGEHESKIYHRTRFRIFLGTSPI